jgi:putative Ca2+/H+ antiporter (TMEM165/GDT1 family)
LEAIINSFLLVFVSEMGDKTQLLALILAARFRKPWTVMAGIFIATIANHGLASWAGEALSNLISRQMLAYILAGIFFVFAAWILIPDKEEEVKEVGHFGALVTTIVAFFMAEMGDKTQLATVALGAQYSNVLLVTLGTTFGMMCSNALAIFFGEKLLRRIPMKWVHRFASALFVLFGIMILIGY